MGLLDDFGSFAKTPEGQGLLAAVFGGLAGARPNQPLNSIGRAGVAGVTGYGNALERNAQISEIEQRKKLQDAQVKASELATAQNQQKLDMIKNFAGKLNGNTYSPMVTDTGAPPAMGQLGSGSFGIANPGSLPAIPQAGTQQLQQQSRLASMTPEEIAIFKMSTGEDLSPIWKTAKEGFERKPGSFYDDVNGRRTYVGDPTKGVDFKDGKVSLMPGAAETQAALAQIGEDAKAKWQVVQVPDGMGGTRTMFAPQAMAALGGAPKQPQPAPTTPNVPAGQTSPRVTQTNTTAPFGTTLNPLQLGDMKNQTDAGGKINDVWLKTSYEPTVAAGQAAQSLIDNTQIARQAMRDMGGTGWGTETKAGAASVLSGLGMAPKNAELYATNAQVFQKAASERSWTVLNNAKGPQTEGDAQRARQTYGQLGNTTQANEFIFDLAEAQAEREKAKSAFFNNALPIAKSKQGGDLSEIEREWNKRMPSIFDMPTMKRWKK